MSFRSVGIILYNYTLPIELWVDSKQVLTLLRDLVTKQNSGQGPRSRRRNAASIRGSGGSATPQASACTYARLACGVVVYWGNA